MSKIWSIINEEKIAVGFWQSLLWSYKGMSEEVSSFLSLDNLHKDEVPGAAAAIL